MVKTKGIGKHKPPSRIRYENNYPVWSVRMPNQWIDDVKDLLEYSGQSRRDFLGACLNKHKIDFEKIKKVCLSEEFDKGYKAGFEEGKRTGYDEGMKAWRIWCYCYNCLHPLYIIPNSKAHQIVIDEMKGWLKHEQCYK